MSDNGCITPFLQEMCIKARLKENRQPLRRKPGWRDVSDKVWDKLELLIPPDK